MVRPSTRAPDLTHRERSSPPSWSLAREKHPADNSGNSDDRIHRKHWDVHSSPPTAAPTNPRVAALASALQGMFAHALLIDVVADIDDVASSSDDVVEVPGGDRPQAVARESGGVGETPAVDYAADDAKPEDPIDAMLCCSYS